MRVLFMGTPDFAVSTLLALTEAFEVVGVLTRPDAVRRRGKELEPSPVKVAAQALGLEVIECSRIDAALIGRLAELGADVGCVAAFGCIVPSALLEALPLGCVNVHPSLLPRWRGAAPIERAILAGDAMSGVSIMRLDEGLDTGEVCLRWEVPCEGRYLADLEEQLAILGSVLAIRAIKGIADGTIEWHPQGDEGVTYAPKIARGELDLDPGDAVIHAWRKVLACDEAHPARICVGGRLIKILAAAPLRGSAIVSAGELTLLGTHVLVGVRDGALDIERVTPEGKRPMGAASWVRGLRERVVRWTRP